MRSSVTVLALLAWVAAAPLEGQVNEEELHTAPLRAYVFQNYEGPHSVFDTAEQIVGIGRELYRSLRDGVGRYYGLFSLIRATDTAGSDLLGADIIVFEPKSGVDHIRNVRRIIEGLLEEGYGYTRAGAEDLSVWVVAYNAQHRGDIQELGRRYSPAVMRHLTPENAGIALRWSDWPGKTRLLIPVGTRRQSAPPAPEGQTGRVSTVSPTPTTAPAAQPGTQTAPRAPEDHAGGAAPSGMASGRPETTTGSEAGAPEPVTEGARPPEPRGTTEAAGPASALPSGGAASAGPGPGAATGEGAGVLAVGELGASSTAGAEPALQESEAGTGTGEGTTTAPGTALAAAGSGGAGPRAVGAVGSPRAWVLVLIAVGAAGLVALAVLAASRARGGGGVPLGAGRSRRNTERARRAGHPVVEMVVTTQNHNIGHRNVHHLRPGMSRSVGGGRSAYLVYFVPVPRNVASLRYDGSTFTFVPRRLDLFPGLSGPVPDCLGREIRAVSPRGYPFTIVFRKYRSPLEEINEFMRSIRR